MSLINLEDLLRPVSEAAPSGENLEYSSEFMDLERAAQGKPEQRMGAAVVAGEPPDFRLVLELSLGLLTRTKDLRVAVHAFRALAQRDGVEGIHDGLALVRGLLEGFWSSVHPQLDVEDNDDPTMRITALSALAAPALVASVRAVPLVRSAMGAATFKDMQGDGAVDSATLEAVFQAADPASLSATATWLQQSLAHLAAIDAVFDGQTGSRGPDLSALSRLLREGLNSVNPRIAALEPVEMTAAALETAPGVAATPASRAGVSEIGSREDVLRVLDKLCAYYARFEPSSPLPLLLQRCKRLVPMNFIDIVRDLAPDGLGQIEVIAGKAPDAS